MEPMSSLGQALRLLSLFGESSPTLRVTEVAAAADLPKSSASRLMKELAEAGFLERAGDSKAYRVGPEIFRIGTLYGKRMPLEERIDEACRRLVGIYPATAYVGVLRGLNLIVVRRHEGSHPVRYIQEPGSSIPAFATAVGKALLSRLSDPELMALLPGPMHSTLRQSSVNRRDLMKELREARSRGYATMDDPILRIGAVGVSVFPNAGRAMAFAVCYSAEVLGESERLSLVEEMLLAAKEIGRIGGDRYWE